MSRKQNILGDSNMKKIVLAALASSVALSATPALAAPSDSQNFDITANIQQECSVEDPANVDFGTLAINQAPGSGALQVTQGLTNKFQDVWVSCNYGADMAMSSGPMTTTEVNDGPDSADFTDVIHIKMGIDPSDGTAFRRMFFDTLTKTGDSKTNADAFHDQAKIKVVFNPADLGGKRPLAGAYTAVATLSVGPI
jgi:type 1 fimbria pilin